MADVVVSIGAGVVFGLALAAPPGPMNAVIAEESVLHGWTAGFRAGLGAMSADAVFFVLSLVGVVAFVDQFPTVRGLMVGVGGLLMLYFAYGAAGELGATFDPSDETVADGGETGEAGAGFRKAFLLAITNPYQILFWLTIGVALLESGQFDVLAQTPYVGGDLSGVLVVEKGSPALVAGFFGGILLWITGFPAALVTAERRVERFAPVVTALSALVLAGFGLLFLADAAGTLL
jgi:threonine/homoserine/homoserine lactone efflux protein